MTQRTSIHISTINAFLAGCRRRGVPPAAIMARVGESHETLADPAGRFPVAKVGDFLAAIALELRDETLGFLERPTSPGGMEMWIHACITSNTLGEAIERWIRFWRLVHRDQLTRLAVDGEEARLSTVFIGDVELDRSSFVTWEMFLMLRLASWLIDKPLLLDRLHFEFVTPPDPEDYNDMFPARHYFGSSENCIVFNRRFLAMPVVRLPDHIPDFIANLPHLMSVQRVDLSLTAQIRRMLQAAERVEELTLGVVAQQLSRSEDTVRRHLKVEGSHFSEIKESVRRDRAVYHLQCLGTPIHQIAYMLGFSEPSSFNRAFKRWTGQTPGDYRRQVA
jgi:AraC-like DNA-binding protein